MRILPAMIALSLAPTAAAQGGARTQACPATPAALPPELAAWRTRAPLAAATSEAAANRATLVIGRAALLQLSPTSSVRYPVRPGKPGGPSNRGGMASFTVTRPGTYRIALGSGMWIDVVRDGKAVASTAHAHGPACSGIRKLVDFRLTPGRYLVQLSGGNAPSVAVMIAATD